jgi:glutathione S-transferase
VAFFPLQVLSEMLGDKQFFFGDEPRTLDLITFVQIAILLAVDPDVACPLRDFINSDCQNLVGVYTRMKVRDCEACQFWRQILGSTLSFFF